MFATVLPDEYIYKIYKKCSIVCFLIHYTNDKRH